MEKNVGGLDRFSRWVIGGSLVAFGLRAKGLSRWVALGLGANVLGTAASGKCLMNRWLGVNTCTCGAHHDTEAQRQEESAQENMPLSSMGMPGSEMPARTTP